MTLGPVRGGQGGGIHLTISPPVDFILRQTGAFRRGLDDFRRLWDRVKPVMAEIEQERWDNEGPGWAGLAASTVEQKLRHGWPLDILVRTGELRDSLVDPGQAAREYGRSLVWETDVPYAGFHQEGTDRMPARPVIDLDADDRRRLEREVVGWVNDVARHTWGRI